MPGRACPLVQIYYVVSQPINLWKVSSCKHVRRCLRGFGMFLTVKNLSSGSMIPASLVMDFFWVILVK